MRYKTLLTIWALGAIMGSVLAQDTGVVSLSEQSKANDGDVVVGKPGSDILQGNGGGFGYALRRGGIVPKSETVFVDGKLLAANSEYWIDYANGAISFAVPLSNRQIARVSYRYSESLASSAGTYASLPLAFRLGQMSSLNMVFGMNPLQRLKDGTTIQSSVMGFNSSFKLTDSANLQSVMFYSSQQNMTSHYDGNRKDKSSNKSQTGLFMLQKVSFGGSEGFNVSANYQNIGSGFNGFSALQNQGYTADQVNQWSKEKGLTRYGISLGYNQKGGMGFNSGFNMIDDGKGSIRSVALGFKTGGLDMYYNSRSVDSSFTRFNDIAESDRAQLAKEKGLDRESFGGAFKFNGGTLQYTNNAIKDNKESVTKQGISLDLLKLKFNYTTQKISQNFTRFNDLAEGEKGQWAKERGLSRQGFMLSFSNPFENKKDLPWSSYTQNLIESKTGYFRRTLLNLSGSAWSAEWGMQQSSENFGRMSDLSDAEKTDIIKQIKRQFNAGDQAVDAKELAQVGRENNLSRRFLNLSAQLKDITLRFNSMNIGAETGALNRYSFGIDSKQYAFHYTAQDISDGFSRLPDLAEAVKGYYGNEVGMKHVNWDATLNMIKGVNLMAMQMMVGDKYGSASRETIRLKTNKYDVVANFRNVDKDFTRSMDVADGERDYLRQLQGFKQYDVAGKFQLLRNMVLETTNFSAVNSFSDFNRKRNRYSLSWTPTPVTKIVSLNDHLNYASSNTLDLRDVHDLISVEHNFGKYGKFNAYDDFIEKRGSLSKDNYEQRIQFWHYEGTPVAGASLVAENKLTTYDDGRYEDVEIYTLKRAMSKRLTMAMARYAVERNEGAADEERNVVAVDYQLAEKSVISYTYNEYENSIAPDVETQSVSLNQGLIGNVQIAGKYETANIENAGSKNTLEIGAQNAKPFRLLWFHNFTFAFGTQSSESNNILQRENITAKVSCMLGSNTLGMNYGSVYTANGVRAIDRLYSFQSDPDPKKRFHFDISHKQRTLPTGEVLISSKRKLDYNIGHGWKLLHEANLNPDNTDAKALLGSNIVPTGTQMWSLTGELLKQVKIEAFYNESYDDTKRKASRRTGFNFNGKFANNGEWSAGYSYEIFIDGSQRQMNNVIHLKYGYKVNDENFMSFGLDMVDHECFVPTGQSRYTIRVQFDWSKPL